MKTIEVLLVDDHDVVREGLRRMLDLQDDMKIIGEAANGEEAIMKAKKLSPDVILMDIKMPGMNGIEAARRLKEQGCPAKTIMLTVYQEDKFLAQAAEAGAVGYLLKDVNHEDLSNAVRIAHMGQSPLNPSISKKLLSQFAQMVRGNRDTILTPRQLEILRLIAAGLTNKKIAQKLYLSEPTVKRNISAIFEKLEAVDRSQAVAQAYAKNLL